MIPHDRREEFAGIPHEEGFFADLELIEGSREALLELSQDHDIYIASAAMEVPSSFAAKYEWLQKNFAFIPTSQIVFCGDKNVVNADILMDDRSRHFKEFRGTGILFTAPHNAKEDGALCGRTTGMTSCGFWGAGSLSLPARSGWLERFR